MPCPFDGCGSSDAFHEYADGYYCFSCGKSKKKERMIASIIQDECDQISRHPRRLPSDYTRKLPETALAYLAQYGIDQHLIDYYRIGYSPKLHRIIFPITFGQSRVIKYGKKHISVDYWHGRANYTTDLKWLAPTGPKFPKLYTAIKGRTEPRTLVIVEDPISAMKLSALRVDALALFTCKIGWASLYEHVIDHATRYNIERILIWLDNDNKIVKDSATNIKRQLALFEIDAEIISDKTDPKHYSYDELRETLGGSKE